MATPYECNSLMCVGAEVVGCGRVAGWESVELVDGRVAVGLVVDHGDLVAGACEDECCGQAGGASADHDRLHDAVARVESVAACGE